MSNKVYDKLMSKESKSCDICVKTETDLIDGELRKIETVAGYKVCEECKTEMRGEFAYTAGFHFAVCQICEHCKAEGPPQRVGDEEIEAIRAGIKKRIADGWPGNENEVNYFWRHTPYKTAGSILIIAKLCKASSLHEAWRLKDV
jgi:hypothetical protein